MEKTVTTTWEYDDLNRVNKEIVVHYDSNASQTLVWEYDAAGNRTKQTLVKNGTTITTYEYDTNDRLLREKVGGTTVVSYEYGGPSNPGTRMTKKTVSGVATNYVYNYQGRMSQAGTTVYQYDTTGTRISEKAGSATRTDFLIDALNQTGYSQVFAEKQGSTLKAFYAFGTDAVSQYTSANGVLYFLKDGLSNTRATLTTAGAVSERYAFDAFGGIIGTTPTKTKLLYSGEMLDTTNGMYYLRARWYDPKNGRFNRLDPFWGNASDPQSLHKYTYCHGDPVNHVDPSGLFLLANMSVSCGIANNLRMLGISTYTAIFRGVTNAIQNASLSDAIIEMTRTASSFSDFFMKAHAMALTHVKSIAQRLLPSSGGVATPTVNYSIQVEKNAWIHFTGSVHMMQNAMGLNGDKAYDMCCTVVGTFEWHFFDKSVSHSISKTPNAVVLRASEKHILGPFVANGTAKFWNINFNGEAAARWELGGERCQFYGELGLSGTNTIRNVDLLDALAFSLFGRIGFSRSGKVDTGHYADFGMTLLELSWPLYTICNS